MITIKELSIDNESAEKIIDLIKKHEPKIWNVLKVELKQLTLTDVVKSFYCWDEQALGKERRCQEECETCASVRKEK
jgi:hypothetical protein